MKKNHASQIHPHWLPIAIIMFERTEDVKSLRRWHLLKNEEEKFDYIMEDHLLCQKFIIFLFKNLIYLLEEDNDKQFDMWWNVYMSIREIESQ